MHLFNRRWHVRTLALLYQHNGARFVVLKHALGISADSLTRCLTELIELGWVQRNPGYGHPLRPEYILTAPGRVVAGHCADLHVAVDRLGVAAAVYRKWSVPSLLALHDGVTRFNDLRNHLAVTPRALTQALQILQGADLVRQPKAYAITASGSHIARLAAYLPD